MKHLFVVFFFVLSFASSSQELFPYTEPASNMPSRSISLKTSSFFQQDAYSGRTMQRHMPEVMFGLNKAWMVHLGTNFSNMHQSSLIWEGARLYAKYRFLSNDDVHKHLMGEQSGVQGGIIATQLVNRFALSATGSWSEVLNNERWQNDAIGRYAVRSVNYTLSAGYLLLPFEYKDYNQTNVNLYVEMLGSRNVDFPPEKYYVDLAPAVQAIFNSTAKLNLGYRFQLSSDIHRLSKNSWMISFEYIFLNALKRKARCLA
ncbi:MAG: hypothetical protein EON98_06640 [Chitinophagaceae bacterium]|nr:MAG: hypothetical protein EON98_06640 [Chitinophagaceae bacterium]